MRVVCAAEYFHDDELEGTESKARAVNQAWVLLKSDCRFSIK